MEDKNERLSLLADLIKMANADEEIREIERAFLLSIAAQLDISPLEFNSLFDTYIQFTPPKMEFDRILQLQRLVLLMSVDLNVDNSEIEMVKNLGIRMGLHPTATNSVLEEMTNYENNVVPPARLIEIFRTFHN
jgi:uncharacterized tellurite resistance protein B-like protein